MHVSNSITITIDTNNGIFLSSAALTYQWLYEGDTLIGETSNTLDYTTTGDGAYEVFGTDANGCVMKDIYFLNLNDISENNANDISIFPNPTNGEIQITNGKNTLTEVSLLDATGKLLIHISNSNHPQEILSINLKNYSRGVYFIEAKTENGKVVKRVVKN
jgi:hypothetical protein